LSQIKPGGENWRTPVTMFLFPPRLDRRVVDAGRVFCPRRGSDVDVDRCAGCEFLTAFDDRANPPTIRCRPDCALPAFLLRAL